MKEYYSRLFLQDGASLAEVKKAYRKLVKKFHPDKNSESNEYTEEFKLIHEAYEILVKHLSNPDSESEPEKTYDRPNSGGKSSGSGIVKHTAKYAEAVEDNEGTSVEYAVLGMVIIYSVCSIMAVINSSSIIFQTVSIVGLVCFFSAYFIGPMVYKPEG
jgi:hypothetical protein